MLPTRLPQHRLALRPGAHKVDTNVTNKVAAVFFTEFTAYDTSASQRAQARGGLDPSTQTLSIFFLFFLYFFYIYSYIYIF